MWRDLKFYTSILWIYFKFLHVTVVENFRYLHICQVEKFLHITDAFRFLHIKSVYKSEISPHERFFANFVCEDCDKYEV